jgi:hypothetical protein
MIHLRPLTTLALVLAPILAACSSDAPEATTIPTAAAPELTPQNNACTSTRLQAARAACSAFNVGLDTCASRCIGVNPITCAASYEAPDSSTACFSPVYDCHNHACNGGGACVPTTPLPNGTACTQTTGICAGYGASFCSAGTCGAPVCHYAFKCATDTTCPACGTTPAC